MDLFQCCLSYEEREAKRIHKEIERILSREKRDSLRCYKLLLLGTGESGKSTFIKQMRIIHGTGFDEHERRAFLKFVHQNVFQSIKCLIYATRILGIPYLGKKNRIDRIDAINSEIMFTLTSDQLNTIQKLWHDTAIQEAYRRRNEYQLSDSTSYFMSRLETISKSNYIPTIQDILHVRVPTTGIVEHKFQVKNVNFEMIDVSGQRSERRKWFHCFDNVTSVIFLVSLSEYDQNLYEDHRVNRLDESIGLYQKIVSCDWFERASVILFLNKVDLLEEKILQSHLEDYFPEFTGRKLCATSAKNFILSKFAEINTGQCRKTFSHFTCATDTKNIEVVFTAVKDTILAQRLEEYNLYP